VPRSGPTLGAAVRGVGTIDGDLVSHRATERHIDTSGTADTASGFRSLRAESLILVDGIKSG